jgi:uncharacterized protein (DUF1800 family)
MTPPFSTFAAIRYGFGLSPNVAAPTDLGEMLGWLREPDVIVAQFPIAGFEPRRRETAAWGELRKALRAETDGAEAAFKAANLVALSEMSRDLVSTVNRVVASPDGFRERLVQFWADHFTVDSSGKGLRFVTLGYVEDAIRPNITGNFRDLLAAVELHPAMLVYLDQILSFGPTSKIGLKAGRGLNENLAREILELHTLGVGGGYGQTDVRQFAELLTGLDFNFRNGFRFRAGTAEPGAETVLGRSYGGGRPGLADIRSALDDIALHPDTARHLARKLVVHFISDDPDPQLVAAMAAAYLAKDGDLMALYETMLDHPVAWQGFGQKAKKPFDFVVSTFRALGVAAETLAEFKLRETRQYLSGPLTVMGQPFLMAPGPNGFPEALDHWITPQGLAARIEWALIIVQKFGGELDPGAFARTALAEVADPALVRLVGAAESKTEGVALVLASPEFNRR